MRTLRWLPYAAIGLLSTTFVCVIRYSLLRNRLTISITEKVVLAGRYDRGLRLACENVYGTIICSPELLSPRRFVLLLHALVFRDHNEKEPSCLPRVVMGERNRAISLSALSFSQDLGLSLDKPPMLQWCQSNGKDAINMHFKSSTLIHEKSYPRLRVRAEDIHPMVDRAKLGAYPGRTEVHFTPCCVEEIENFRGTRSINLREKCLFRYTTDPTDDVRESITWEVCCVSSNPSSPIAGRGFILMLDFHMERLCHNGSITLHFNGSTRLTKCYTQSLWDVEVFQDEGVAGSSFSSHLVDALENFSGIYPSVSHIHKSANNKGQWMNSEKGAENLGIEEDITINASDSHFPTGKVFKWIIDGGKKRKKMVNSSKCSGNSHFSRFVPKVDQSTRPCVIPIPKKSRVRLLVYYEVNKDPNYDMVWQEDNPNTGFNSIISKVSSEINDSYLPKIIIQYSIPDTISHLRIATARSLPTCSSISSEIGSTLSERKRNRILSLLDKFKKNWLNFDNPKKCVTYISNFSYVITPQYDPSFTGFKEEFFA